MENVPWPLGVKDRQDSEKIFSTAYHLFAGSTADPGLSAGGNCLSVSLSRASSTTDKIPCEHAASPGLIILSNALEAIAGQIRCVCVCCEMHFHTTFKYYQHLLHYACTLNKMPDWSLEPLLLKINQLQQGKMGYIKIKLPKHKSTSQGKPS